MLQLEVCLLQQQDQKPAKDALRIHPPPPLQSTSDEQSMSGNRSAVIEEPMALLMQREPLEQQKSRQAYFHDGGTALLYNADKVVVQPIVISDSFANGHSVCTAMVHIRILC